MLTNPLRKTKKKTNTKLHEERTRTPQSLKTRKQKKISMQKTAKIPVPGASGSDGAGCRDKLNLMLRPTLSSPPEKAPHFGSTEQQTKEPDRHRGRSYHRGHDNTERPSKSESRGRN